MRKILQQASQAFQNGEWFRGNNTKVFIDSAGVWLELHGNRIAHKDENGLEVTNAGWATSTTKERLNSIPGVWVRQSKGVWYLNGKEWGGEWANIKDYPVTTK
jgi:hypothetical protein